MLTIALVAAASVIFGGQKASVGSQESDQALALARQAIEQARADSEKNFTTLKSSSSTQAEFTKETIVTDIDSYTKEVVSRVSWTTDRTQNVELITRITDPGASSALGGDTGGGGTSGDWQHPTSPGNADLGAGEEATGIDVINKIAFMTAKASDSKKSDFFVVSAPDPEDISVVASIDTGPGPCPGAGCGPGLNAVDAAGSYAYVAQDKTSSQLQIINIANTSSPNVASSFTLPGVSGSGAVGNSIYYYGGRVYIGTKTATGPEFHVVDVSNPLNPVSLGSKKIGADVNGIVVRGTTAYLATSDDNAELILLDVSKPTSSITQLAAYNATGTADGKSIYLVGSKAYLGRASGGDFQVFDVSNPSSPTSLGAKSIGSDVQDVVVRDSLAFLSTNDPNTEFQVYNISDPANITLWGSLNFPQDATGIDYEDNLIYVAVRSNAAFRIIKPQ